MSKLSIVFLLAFISGIIAAFNAGSVWAFYLYEFVYFMNPGRRWWSTDIPELSYSFVVVIVMMVTFFLQRNQQRGIPKLGEAPATKWLVALLVVFFYMYFFALNPVVHKNEAINFVKLLIVMGFAYKMIDTPQKLEYAIWVYIAGCAYIGIEASNMGRNSDGRVEGIGTVDAPDANLISATIAPAIPFLMYFFWKGKWQYKLLAMASGGLILNGLVLINSRGAFLGVLVGGAYFIFQMLFSRSQEKNQRLTAVLVIVAGISAAFSLTDDVFWERMETLTETEERVDGSEGPKGSGRVDFWMKTLDMVEEYPMGLGIGGFEYLSSQYLEKSQLAQGTTIRSVHSMWFQALGELGWVGLLLFACLLMSCYRSTRQLRSFFMSQRLSDEYFRIAALEASMITYLVCGSFLNRFRGELLYWLIMFISVSVWMYLRKSATDEKKKA